MRRAPQLHVTVGSPRYSVVTATSRPSVSSSYPGLADMRPMTSYEAIKRSAVHCARWVRRRPLRPSSPPCRGLSGQDDVATGLVGGYVRKDRPLSSLPASP